MRAFRFWQWTNLLILLCLTSTALAFQSQGPSHLLFGDVRLAEEEVTPEISYTFVVVLRASNGRIVGRDTIPPNGRFRFQNVSNGEYVLTIEADNREIVRDRFILFELKKTDIRRDYELERRSVVAETPELIDSVVYARPSKNEKLFAEALTRIEAEEWEVASQLLEEITSQDAADYEAWTELGTAYFHAGHFAKAESAYQSGLGAREDYILALANLGKLRLVQEHFEPAAEALLKAAALERGNAEVHYLLGEAFLGMKRGSRAVPYFREALELEPMEMAHAHLRLASLFDAAGYRELAAHEYLIFLEKNPDFSDRGKLRSYIRNTLSR